MEKINSGLRIAVIAAGGTIASSYNSVSGEITLCGGMPEVVSSTFDDLSGVEPVLIETKPYSSENAMTNDYRRVLAAVSEQLLRADTDGAVVLHGTDTMTYFVQLAVRALTWIKKPVVITGSRLTPDMQGSDAAGNVRAAVNSVIASVSEGKFGVEAVFTESSEDRPRTVPGECITDTDINGDYRICAVSGTVFYSKEYEARARTFLKRCPSPRDRVMIVGGSPDFPFDSVLPDAEKYASIIIRTYHSGTACISDKGEGGLPTFCAEVAKKGIKCFAAPVSDSRGEYQSAAFLRKSGILFLKGLPFEGVWAEIVL